MIHIPESIFCQLIRKMKNFVCVPVNAASQNILKRAGKITFE
jgi:hypothetical protein